MAGLLDNFSQFAGTPQGQGLLAAAFGGLAGARRGQPINSLGRAGLAGLAGYSGAQDRVTQEAQIAEVNKYRNMQTAAMQAQMDAAKAKTDQEAAKRNALPGLFGGQTVGGGTTTPEVAGIPMFSQGSTVQPTRTVGAGKLDVQAALRAGYTPEEIVKMGELANVGRQKVARTIKAVENGREVEIQLDELGQRVGEGFQQYRAPIQADTGGAVQFLDPFTQRPISSLPKSMSPEGADASKRGWATVGQGAARLALDRQNAAGNGYTFNADLGGYVPKAPGGQFVPLQGGPAAGTTKLTESEGKNTLYLSQMRDASNTLDALEKGGKAVSPALVAATGSPYTNFMAGKTAQQAGQTQRQWAEAYLRAKTGAAATSGEVDNNIRTFFPVVGDDDETIKQKRAARNQAEQDMTIPAGRGADRAVARKPPETSPQDKQAMEWANANPNDPRAAQIKQRLGGR